MPDLARKVLFVGLDGMPFEILGPLMESGAMPNVRALAERSATTDLVSAIPPLTPPAWTAFLTGKGPGLTRILDFRHFDAATRSERLGSSRDLHSATLFDLLSEAGMTVGVVHLPMHYPPPELNGFVVSGHETPGRDAAFTWPPELREEVLETVPDYLFHVRVEQGYQTVDHIYRETIERVLVNIRGRGDLAVHLLTTRDPDAFLVHFQSLDAVLHFAYEYLDGRDEERRRLLVSCFTEADRQVGRILEAAGDRLTVVLSDHGFGSLDLKVYPNVLLEEWGLLKLAPGIKRKRVGLFRRVAEETPLRRVREALHERKKRRKARRGERGKPRPMRRAQAGEIAKILPLDWRETTAYVPVSGTHGLVYLNLAGREPEGTVPAEDYDRVRADLARRFREARHRAWPRPLFAEAKTPEEVWGVETRETGPDLILFPDEEANVIRDIVRESEACARNRRGGGTHRMKGILLISGPGVDPGARDFDASLVDVAPTILRYLDLAVPEDVEGRALEEAFVTLPPAKFRPPPDLGKTGDEAAYDEEESRLLEDHLRGLGYL
ncbi:MAG: alkaline phosphatase family protein [Planctomycetota bacterium]|jgi:predicted AlkP superfamily phosphohydrolase/phosphomutase